MEILDAPPTTGVSLVVPFTAAVEMVTIPRAPSAATRRPWDTTTDGRPLSPQPWTCGCCGRGNLAGDGACSCGSPRGQVYEARTAPVVRPVVSSPVPREPINRRNRVAWR